MSGSIASPPNSGVSWWRRTLNILSKPSQLVLRLFHRSTAAAEPAILSPETLQETSPVVPGAQADVQELLRTSSNPRIKRLLQLPDFPDTAEEAADLLGIARSSREERSCLKLATEHAVHQGARELQALNRRHPDPQIVESSLEDLKTLQEELATTSAHLVESDREIGVVRSLITHKGLPLHFEFNTVDPELRQTTPGSDDHDMQSELDSRCASALEI